MLRKLVSISIIAVVTGLVFNLGLAEGKEAETITGEKEIKAGKTLIVGCIPCDDVSLAYRELQPLLKFLSKATGMKFKLYLTKSSDELRGKIARNEIDFVYIDPYGYIKLSDKYGIYAIVTASKPKSGASYKGIIIVRKDSGIDKIDDLKGKRIKFGPRDSSAKYFAPVVLLKEHGIGAGDLGKVIYGGDCDEISFSVYVKEVDAGAICDYSFPKKTGSAEKIREYKIETVIEPDELKIIGSTISIPNWPVASCRHTDKDIADKVRQILVNLNEKNPDDMEILKRLHLKGFETASDKDYDGMRELADKFGMPY